jgi:hypothetical protein
MVNRTVVPEQLEALSILKPQVGGAGDQAYILPTGARTVYLVAHVEMGNATDVVLVPKTADDATGTNAAVLADTVPIWENGTKQTSAKNHTVDDASGNFVVVFAIPANIIPEGKFVGMSYAASNNANLLSCMALVDTYYSN